MAVSWQKINEAEFMQLHADGMTDPELAKHFGVSKATIQEFRKRRGLSYNGRGKRWKRGKSKSAPTSPPKWTRAKRIKLIREIASRAWARASAEL